MMPASAVPEMKFGVVPVDAFRSHDALTVLRAMLRGEYPAPPIMGALPFILTDVDKGRVIFEGTPSEALYNGELCTTVETKVSFGRPVMPSTGPVRAEAHIIHAGSRAATAEGRLTDTAGRLYAHGTTTCLRFPL